MQQQQKVMNNKKKRKSNSKILVRVNVLGSTGPLRLLVKEDDSVADVVESALKAYSKEGRFPSLGSKLTNNNDFVLYEASTTDYCQALNPGEAIGRSGVRSFVMCKQQLNPAAATMTEGRSSDVNIMSRKASSSTGLKKWLTRSFTSFKF